MCQDVSCLIICQIENQQLGVKFQDLVMLEILQCALVSFVDNTDMMTDREKARKQMQKIINIYNKLYGATGGYIEDKKFTYYAWQWHRKQRQKVTKEITKQLWINKRLLKQMSIKESVKSLGIYINPKIEWIKQFEMVKEKLFRTMSKLCSTPLTIANAYLYFNMYLIKQVYYGCEIVSIITAQEKILMKISESTLLKKLGLSEKFP